MSATAISVRSYTEADGENVKAVLLDAYGEFESTLTAEQWEHYRSSIVASIADAATSARLVAVLDGQIVGSVFLFDSSDKAYGNPELNIQTPIIRLLAVSRRARGRGVATELIRASARLAAERGEDTLHLHTSDVMASAVRLYERLGFERAYDKEFHVGDILVKSYRLHLNRTPLLAGDDAKEETSDVRTQAD